MGRREGGRSEVEKQVGVGDKWSGNKSGRKAAQTRIIKARQWRPGISGRRAGMNWWGWYPEAACGPLVEKLVCY